MGKPSPDPAIKRVRPLLGTFISVQIEAHHEEADLRLTRAFQLAEGLERSLSKFREDSDLNRINNAAVGVDVAVPPAFSECLTLALKIWEHSEGAFSPFGGAKYLRLPLKFDAQSVRKTETCRLDLTGIAKGFVVDQMVQVLSGLSGVVNAGGDMRFFNRSRHQHWHHADLRFADQVRRLEFSENALATSCPAWSARNPRSTTAYFLSRRASLSENHSVSALAESCAVADALCKVGLFGASELVILCARDFNARILCFDSTAELSEEFA
jgi:thiamine biosynthesis lipoprotein